MRAKLAGVCLIAAALALAAGADAQQGAPTTITDIRQESGDRSTRLVVECTGPLAYTYYSPDPLTLVVDIPDVDASPVPARVNVGTREVESIRVTNLARADGRNLARVEVRLASLVPYQIFSKDRALNLVFERPAAVAAEPAAAPPRRPPRCPSRSPSRPGRGGGGGRRARRRRRRRSSRRPTARVRRPAAIVAVTRDEVGGQLAFTVKADGRLDYRDFMLAGPDRLVVDFPDVTARATVRQIEIGQDPVRKVRLGQFSAASPKVARLVLDLSKKAPYRIIDGVDGVRIVFGDGRRRRRRARAGPATRGAARSRDRGRAGARSRGARARSGRDDEPGPAAGGARAAGAARAAGPGARGDDTRRVGRSRPGQLRNGLRPSRRPRHSDQPRLQGRRPPGHLPPLLRHLAASTSS